MAEQLEIDFTFPDPPPTTLPDLWTADDIFKHIVDHGAAAFGELPVEDDRIEWKSSRYDPRQLAAYISMWANTQPAGGNIIIGVENDGTITGCKGVGAQKISDLSSAASDYCADARYDLRKVPVILQDGQEDFLLLIRVLYRPDRLVETNRGEAFVRTGNKKRQLTEPEKREVRIGKGEIHYEQEPCQLEYPDDFDGLLIEEFCNRYRSIRRLREHKTHEQILRLNHLGE